MQQTCAPLCRLRQTSATCPTNAAGATTAKRESDELGPVPLSPGPPSSDYGWHEKPASTMTDWFMSAHPVGSARFTPRKTYRDVDTGVSWDAP